MVIDNRSGAGGNLAAATIARADPHGYSLLVGYTGHTYAPRIYTDVGFDFGRDFAPVSALARAPLALALNKSRLDAADFREFAAAAQRNPESIEIATSGLGTLPHLAVELLQRQAGLRLLHVPYRGGAPALQDLLAGQVTAMIGPIGLFAGHATRSDLRIVAVASRRREALAPDVPTFAECGGPGFRVSQWFGLFAPINTPGSILDRLHLAVQSALANEEVRRLWAEQGARVELESRADFSDFVVRETMRWNRIASDAKLKLD